jgi:hypothetical protein
LRRLEGAFDDHPNSEYPDAHIFAAITSCGERWDNAAVLDERAVKLRRAGKLAEVAELDRRHNQLTREACKLDQRIIHTDARTRRCTRVK